MNRLAADFAAIFNAPQSQRPAINPGLGESLPGEAQAATPVDVSPLAAVSGFDLSRDAKTCTFCGRTGHRANHCNKR